MRALLAGLLALAVALAGRADDPNPAGKPDEPKADKKEPSRADKVKAMQKEMQAERQKLLKEYNAATEAKDKQEIAKKYQGLGGEYAGRAMALAEEDPKDEAALDALGFVLDNSTDPDLTEKAVGLVADHHATGKNLRRLIPGLAQSGAPAATKLLRRVMAEHPDRAARGLAAFSVGEGLLEKTRRAKAPEETPEGKEAVALLERVSKEFADVKYGRKTLGKAADGLLFAVRNLAIGKVAPDVESQDLDGKKVKLSDHKGKVVVLDIWATWCGPCRAMIPHERELVDRLKDKPFVLVSVSADDKKETLAKFIEKEPMPWVHWWAGPAAGIVEDWNVRYYPTIYVIDAKGVIRYKDVRGKAMDTAVEKLLKEAEEAKPKTD